MPTCQNGWPASPNREHIVSIAVGGVTFPGGVHDGDVATVFQYVAEQWNARVETLTPGWCWGYNYREVRGGADLSNHSGGYALDFDAPNHPLGKVGTFSAAQVREIHSIIDEVAPACRWGGDYANPARGGVKGSRVDEMHVEIVGSPAQVATVAAKIRADGLTIGNVPASGSVGGMLQRGSTGDAVKELQRVLNAWYPDDVHLVVDGDFGPATEAAVRLLQTRTKGRLVVDGIAGPRTLGVLGLA